MRVFTLFLSVDLAANFEFTGSRKQKTDTAYDRFHGNGPVRMAKIPTKKEPIRKLESTSRLKRQKISEVEHELHFIFSCQLNNNLRSKFFADINKRYPHFNDLDKNLKLVFLYDVDPLLYLSTYSRICSFMYGFKGNLHYFNKYRLKCLKCTY